MPRHLHILLPAALVACAAAAFAQGTSVAFGSARQDPDTPVEVTAQELLIDQEDGTAVFTGNVNVDQGEMKLSAPRVLVIYKDDNSGIERLEATGGVTILNGPDTAEASEADYIIDDGMIFMSGDVLLLQGANTVASDRMTVDLDAGTAQMNGRVRTILQTNNDN